MDFLLENWWLILVAAAGIAVAAFSIYTFVKKPSSEQILQVKEWLLYAVAAAEKELGGGTGQLKLRYVYDMFIVKFPTVARIITFDTFCFLVDEALDKFKLLLQSNSALQDYINNKHKEE